MIDAPKFIFVESAPGNAFSGVDPRLLLHVSKVFIPGETVFVVTDRPKAEVDEKGVLYFHYSHLPKVGDLVLQFIKDLRIRKNVPASKKKLQGSLERLFNGSSEVSETA